MYYPAGWPFWLFLFNLGVPVSFGTKVLTAVDGTEFFICPALGVSIERCSGEEEDAAYDRLMKLMKERYFELTGEYFEEE